MPATTGGSFWSSDRNTYQSFYSTPTDFTIPVSLQVATDQDGPLHLPPLARREGALEGQCEWSDRPRSASSARRDHLATDAERGHRDRFPGLDTLRLVSTAAGQAGDSADAAGVSSSEGRKEDRGSPGAGASGVRLAPRPACNALM